MQATAAIKCGANATDVLMISRQRPEHLTILHLQDGASDIGSDITSTKHSPDEAHEGPWLNSMWLPAMVHSDSDDSD